MAVAGGNAAVPAVGERVVGSRRSADLQVGICSVSSRADLKVSATAVLVALHGFVKKTRTTPDEDLALARKRQKELEQ